MIPNLLNIHQTAAILKISVKTLRRMMKDSKAPEHIKVSKQIRFSEDAVKKFIANEDE